MTESNGNVLKSKVEALEEECKDIKTWLLRIEREGSSHTKQQDIEIVYIKAEQVRQNTMIEKLIEHQNELIKSDTRKSTMQAVVLGLVLGVPGLLSSVWVFLQIMDKVKGAN